MTADDRKVDHIRLCLDPVSQFDRRSAGFDAYWFEHNALPELEPGSIELAVTFLGKRLAAPFLLSSMTGGPELGARLNRHLAEAAEATGIAMAVGSERVGIEDPSRASSFAVRQYAPTTLLFGNLGAVQLNYGFGIDEANRAVEIAGADGLFLHLNPMQELVQPGGDTDFRGIEAKIERLCAEAEFPILAKECGAGISADVCGRLLAAGIAAVDVSGAGGTSWTKVEAERAVEPIQAAVGRRFGNWGIPTTIAIETCRGAYPGAALIASGGIRSGHDAAIALAMGADMVSIAQPVLHAATQSTEAVVNVIETFVAELRAVCFGIGVASVEALTGTAALKRWR